MDKETLWGHGERAPYESPSVERDLLEPLVLGARPRVLPPLASTPGRRQATQIQPAMPHNALSFNHALASQATHQS